MGSTTGNKPVGLIFDIVNNRATPPSLGVPPLLEPLGIRLAALLKATQKGTQQ